MEALAERAFLRGLAAGCHTPVAAHACADARALTLTGLVASLDGRTVIRSAVSGAELGRGGARPEARRGAPRAGCGGGCWRPNEDRSAHDASRWRSARPLAGRVIVVTRAREQAAALRGAPGGGGRHRDARRRPSPSSPPIRGSRWTRRSRARLEYRWAIFTSVNGVAMVRPPPRPVGARQRRRCASCRIAAIGPATADALRSTACGSRWCRRSTRPRPRRAAAARIVARGPRPPGAGRRDARRARARAPAAGRRRRRRSRRTHARGARAGRRPAQGPRRAARSTS